MKSIKNLKSYGRLLALTGLMALTISGGAYAALQSAPATVKGNTIQTANANLQIGTDNLNYGTSLTGYAFNNLIPGASPIPSIGYPIYLRNGGTTNLATKVSISKPVTNLQAVDLAKVHLILSPNSGGVPQNITFQDLLSSASSGGVALTNSTASRLTPNQTFGFSAQVSMDADAINGSSATLSDIDLSFSATAVN